jgi:hypothetical protein
MPVNLNERASVTGLRTYAGASFLQRTRQVVSERANGGFRRPACGEHGVQLDGLQMPVRENPHECAAFEFGATVPESYRQDSEAGNGCGNGGLVYGSCQSALGCSACGPVVALAMTDRRPG